MSLTGNNRGLVPSERGGFVDVLDDEDRELDTGGFRDFPRLAGSALPMTKDRRSVGLLVSFGVCVLLPTLLAALYFGVVASPQYVSEFRFSVTNVTPTLPGQASASTAVGGNQTNGISQALNSALGGVGGQATMGSGTQDYLVVDYLKSAQVISDIRAMMAVQSFYERPTIDKLSRFPRSGSKEDFERYWRRMVTARYDPVTGLAVAQVRAFSPGDAKQVADALVTLSERLVNNIALRSNLDAVKAAQQEVDQAQARLQSARQQISAFRTAHGVIDPTQSSVPVNNQLEATLKQSIVQLQAQLDVMNRQGLSGSPSADVVRAQLQSARGQLAGVESQVAKSSGDNQALVGMVSQYEQLNTQEQFAQNLLVGAMQSLVAAKATAAQQLLYLTPYVRPALADKPSYPQKLRSTLYFALVAAGIWLVGLMLFKSVRQQVEM